MHVVMFDIDGTLVDSAGFDSALYVEAVNSVLGVAIDSDWNHYEHVSDSGILDEVLRRLAPAEHHAALAARVQRHFVALVGEHLERRSETVREIAGAKRSCRSRRCLSRFERHRSDSRAARAVTRRGVSLRRGYGFASAMRPACSMP